MFSKIRSLIFKLDPETAHDLAIKSLKFNFIPQSFFDVENLINYLKKKQIKDSTILVKGSRSIKLGKVIKVL